MIETGHSAMRGPPQLRVAIIQSPWVIQGGSQVVPSMNFDFTVGSGARWFPGGSRFAEVCFVAKSPIDLQGGEGGSEVVPRWFRRGGSEVVPGGLSEGERPHPGTTIRLPRFLVSDVSRFSNVPPEPPWRTEEPAEPEEHVNA